MTASASLLDPTHQRSFEFSSCTCNSGPCYREKVEKEFSVPFDLKAAKAKPSNGNGLVQVQKG